MLRISVDSGTFSDNKTDKLMSALWHISKVSTNIKGFTISITSWYCEWKKYHHSLPLSALRIYYEKPPYFLNPIIYDGTFIRRYAEGKQTFMHNKQTHAFPKHKTSKVVYFGFALFSRAFRRIDI